MRLHRLEMMQIFRYRTFKLMGSFFSSLKRKR